MLKTLKLKSIILKNFKKLDNIRIDFTEQHTIIAGKNGIGKTTMNDAYLWVVTGKDATGRTSFEIKPRNLSGETSKEIESSVSIMLQLNDAEPFTLTKVYKENWSKIRGGEISEFKGNETLYFWDETPVKKEEFEKRLSTIGNDETFKTLANIKYFASLPWQAKRKMFMDFVSIPEVDPGKHLTPKLKNKTPEDLQAEIKLNKKGLVKQIDETPIRIEEIRKGIIELPYTEDEFKEQLNEIDGTKPVGKGGTDKLTELNTRKHEAVEQINTILTGIKQKYREMGNKPILRLDTINSLIQSIVVEKDGYIRQISTLDREADAIETTLVGIRQEYINEDATEFNGMVCPSCNRAYEKMQIESAEEQFNLKKSENLEKIQTRGLYFKANKETIKEKTAELLVKISELEKKELELRNEKNGLNIEELKKSFNEQYLKEVNEHPDLIKLNAETKKIDASIEKIVSKNPANVDANEVQQKRDLILSGLEKWKVNKEHQLRIDELQAKLKEHSTALNALEKTEHELNNFIKKRITLMETALSNEFAGLQIKMFMQQGNGEIVETCDIFQEGVPYEALNTAAKVSASLKIINALSKKTEIFLPVFIDNRESVTELPETTTQLISLLVVPELTELKVFKTVDELNAYIHELTILNNTKTENNVKSSSKKRTNKGGNSAK